MPSGTLTAKKKTKEAEEQEPETTKGGEKTKEAQDDSEATDDANATKKRGKKKGGKKGEEDASSDDGETAKERAKRLKKEKEETLCNKWAESDPAMEPYLNLPDSNSNLLNPTSKDNKKWDKAAKFLWKQLEDEDIFLPKYRDATWQRMPAPGKVYCFLLAKRLKLACPGASRSSTPRPGASCPSCGTTRSQNISAMTQRTPMRSTNRPADCGCSSARAKTAPCRSRRRTLIPSPPPWQKLQP